MEVKKEVWKGKAFYVARDNKGRIASRIAVKGSKLTKQEAIKLFKSRGTFRKGTTRTRLTNVYEVFDTTSKPRINRNIKFLYQFHMYMPTGEVIVARSRYFDPKTTSINYARKEALENLQDRLSVLVGGSQYYDGELGEQVFEELQEQSIIREGVVQYPNAPSA